MVHIFEVIEVWKYYSICFLEAFVGLNVYITINLIYKQAQPKLLIGPSNFSTMPAELTAFLP